MILLSNKFLAPYRMGQIKPKFGPVGAVTYYRTYSRKNKTVQKADGSRFEIQGQMEHWIDNCIRVTEGNFSLTADRNDPTLTEKNAEDFFHYMFTMGIIPPGRGLWMMGTKYQQERGGDALNNCWFIAVRPQSYENMAMYQDLGYIFSNPEKPMPSFPFVFTFDRAMTGGGVGFSVERKNIDLFPKTSTMVNLKIYMKPDHPDWEYIKGKPEWEQLQHILTDDKKDILGHYTFKTADSRQGWGSSYRELIDAHYQDVNSVTLVFDMSDVRGYGELINGFGGTASGPLPLMVLFNDVNQILNGSYRSRITSVDALDILNMTGRCVVAGNVRRTALISAGDPNDQEYVDAKNYQLVAPIMEKENGWVKWDNGKQVRRPYQEVVDEFYEDLKLKHLQASGGKYTEADKELVTAAAKKQADDLFYMAWAQENHRWASNNSVYIDDRFEDWGFLSAGIIANGEPGIINMYLMKNFGRIMDGIQMGIDADAEGTNPCAEITLENGEPCNLVEVLPYMVKQAGLDIFRAIELATQYVFRITFANYEWPVTQRVIQNNHRIGVSLTGMQDYFLDEYGHYVVKGFEEDDQGNRVPVFHKAILDEVDSWYGHVDSVNNAHAAALGVKPAKKKTTMKPSGTVSKLPGLSAGIHFHYAPYLIQRIRFHELDGNLAILRRLGFHIEPAMREPNTMVVSFPVKAPNADHPNFQSAGNTSLEEQFANQYFFAYAWADNAVSATLTFQFEKDEHLQIEKLLSWYGKRVKTISLLPYSGHGYVQAPWEPINKEQYDAMVSTIDGNPEDIYAMLTSLDNIEGLLDADCIGGACPTK